VSALSDAAPAPPSVLIAPLSSKPQLVTIAVDLLCARGERLCETVALHTSPARSATRAALATLDGEFAHRYPDTALRSVCLCDAQGRPFGDIDTEAAARAAFRMLYREIKTAKQQGERVHLSIAGGRKVLAVYAMAAAQLLFDAGDQVWHLVSSPDLVSRAALHPEPGESTLLPIPVLRWSAISPVLTELALSDDPFDAVTRYERWRQADAQRAARQFVQQTLSPAEREVVSLMVRYGLTNAQIGKRTYRSAKTVGHQLSSAYRKARAAYALARADRHTLTSLLAAYFSLEEAGNGSKPAERL